MFDMHNWRISVDQCHAKHIGPPPPLQRRINYDQAHRLPMRTGGRIWSTFSGMLRIMRRLIAAKRS